MDLRRLSAVVWIWGLGCGDVSWQVTPLWPADLDVVVLGVRDGQALDGLPRYLAPRAPLVLELTPGPGVTLEVQTFEPAMGREHILSACGVALAGPLPLRRRRAETWSTPAFDPEQAAPSFDPLTDGTATRLTTAIDCEANGGYCAGVVVTSARPVGSGRFVSIGSLDDADVITLYEDQDGSRRIYRYQGDDLELAPEFDPNPDPNRRIISMSTPHNTAILLYEDGQIWSTPAGGPVRVWPQVPGAQRLVRVGELIYAMGAEKLWLVDTATVTLAGTVPSGLVRAQGMADGMILGVDREGIKIWKSGVWTLELADANLVNLPGGFSIEEPLIYYFSSTTILSRRSSGEWVPETPPDTASPILGGSLTRTGQLAYNDSGSIFIRAGAGEPWCHPESGTSQPIVIANRFLTGFLVGTQADNGTATLINIQPPE